MSASTFFTYLFPQSPTPIQYTYNWCNQNKNRVVLFSDPGFTIYMYIHTSMFVDTYFNFEAFAKVQVL